MPGCFEHAWKVGGAVDVDIEPNMPSVVGRKILSQ